MKTTPLTSLLAAEGAAFGVVNGWERIEYVKPKPAFHESHGFGFTEVFDIVADEVAAVHNGAGLTEISGFNRFELTGGDVHAFLDRMICGKVQKNTGRVGLGYLLNDHGMLKTEATIANLPDGRVWFGSAAAAEYHDMDWLTAHLHPDEDVRITSLTNDYTTLVLAGPRARDVLSDAARGDWSAEAFPWLSVRRACVGTAPAMVLAISFSGELAYEIHVPNAQLHSAYLALRKAGQAHGLRLFGSRAVESMRMEKSYLHWKSDILSEFDPLETGLSRFVDLSKPDFLGKSALLARKGKGPAQKLVTLTLETASAPAHSGASIMWSDRVVGTVTSGDWGHRTGLNLALGFIQADLAETGTLLSVDICGNRVASSVIPASPFDPGNSRVKA